MPRLPLIPAQAGLQPSAGVALVAGLGHGLRRDERGWGLWSASPHPAGFGLGSGTGGVVSMP